MRTRKYAGGLLLRWLALILLKFNISICLRHLAGVLNVHADRLSRWRWPSNPAPARSTRRC